MRQQSEIVNDTHINPILFMYLNITNMPMGDDYSFIPYMSVRQNGAIVKMHNTHSDGV